MGFLGDNNYKMDWIQTTTYLRNLEVIYEIVNPQENGDQ